VVGGCCCWAVLPLIMSAALCRMTAWSPGALRFRGSWRRGGRRGRPAGVLGEEAEEIAVPSLEVVARGGVDAAAAASAAVGSESGFVAAAAAPGSTCLLQYSSTVSRVLASALGAVGLGEGELAVGAAIFPSSG
jgi:hypothetical protein